MHDFAKIVISAAVAAVIGLLVTRFCSYVPLAYRAFAVSICWALVYYYVF
jgi:hypothetical protein